MATERQLWEQQKGESAKAFTAFVVYRDLPSHERSLQSVADTFYGKRRASKGQIEKWSSANGWVARVKAYDTHIDTARLARFEADKLKQRTRRQLVINNLNTMVSNAVLSAGKPGETQEPISIAELNSLARAAATVMNESRLEFHDMPAQKVDNTLTGKDGGPVEVKHSADDITASILSKLAGIAAASATGEVPVGPDSD